MQRGCNEDATKMQRGCNEDATEVQRWCNGGDVAKRNVATSAKLNVATFRARSVSPTSRAHCGVHAHELIVNVQYVAPTRPSETPQPVGGNYYLERKEAAHRVAHFK